MLRQYVRGLVSGWPGAVRIARPGDAAHVQALLNELEGIGGVVYCPPGVYTPASPIEIPSGVWLVGAGRNTVFIPPNNANYSWVNYIPDEQNLPQSRVRAVIRNKTHSGTKDRGIVISGLRIDGNGDNQPINQTWAGIHLDFCEECAVLDCVIENVNYNVDWATDRAYGVLVSRASWVSVERCRIHHIGYECIGFRNGVTFSVAARNHLSDGRQHGMQAAGMNSKAGTAPCYDIVFAHNTILANPDNSGDGITFDGDGTTVLDKRLAAVGNAISGGLKGIKVILAAGDVTIADNVITCSEEAIRISDRSEGVVITGNTLETTGTYKNCVQIESYSKHINLTGNLIRAINTGSRGVQVKDFASHVAIGQNNIVARTTCIQAANNSAHIAIQGNSCAGVDSNSNGIATVDASDNILIANNVLTGIMTAENRVVLAGSGINIVAVNNLV